MTGTATALCAAISIDSTEAAPEWVHLLPAGDVRTVDGRGPYTQGDAAALIAASMARGKLPLDENHAFDRAAKLGNPSPAHAWITELQARADGIWGRAEWVDPAARVWRRYRGISPAIVHDPAKRILAIPRASLVNDPNLTGLTTLHLKEDDTMDFRALLIEMLKLDSGADDAAIAAALRAMFDKDAGVALQSALDPIAVAAGLATGSDAAAIVAGIQQLGSGDAGVIVSLQSELRDVTTRLNTTIEAGQRRDAEAYVDGAIAAGRVGVKPLRDRYVALHMRDRGEAEALIGGMPIVKAGASLDAFVADRGKDGLDDEDRRFCALMGIDPAEYAKTRSELTTEVL